VPDKWVKYTEPQAPAGGDRWAKYANTSAWKPVPERDASLCGSRLRKVRLATRSDAGPQMRSSALQRIGARCHSLPDHGRVDLFRPSVEPLRFRHGLREGATSRVHQGRQFIRQHVPCQSGSTMRIGRCSAVQGSHSIAATRASAFDQSHRWSALGAESIRTGLLNLERGFSDSVASNPKTTKSVNAVGKRAYHVLDQQFDRAVPARPI
jgi:hypothetical protein